MTHPRSLSLVLPAVAALAGCATTSNRAATEAPPPPVAKEVIAAAATLVPTPPPPVVVATPVPLPLPGQLMPIEVRGRADAREPTSRVTAANAAARVEPVRDGFINAVQSYPYTAGALYQVYTAPGHVTDIVLQEGERLAGTGPVAAGDTARWIIGDTTSGAGDASRVHILVKPTRPDLSSRATRHARDLDGLGELVLSRRRADRAEAGASRSGSCGAGDRGSRTGTAQLRLPNFRRSPSVASGARL